MLKEGESVHLNAMIYPENATNTVLSWRSEDEKVAIVDEDGNVTAVGSGLALIVAETTDGSNLSAQCMIKVEGDDSGIDDIEIDKDTEVRIISLQGKVLYTGKFAEARLMPGVYIVRCSDGSASKVFIR